MRAYELCLIVHADTTEDGLQSLLSSIEATITKNKGSLLNIEQWGKKNFKYAIKKQTKGLYCFITFNGDNTVLKDLDRSIRYNEQVLRYDTILLPKGVAVASRKPSAEPASDSIPDSDQTPDAQAETAMPEDQSAEAPTEQ